MGGGASTPASVASSLEAIPGLVVGDLVDCWTGDSRDGSRERWQTGTIVDREEDATGYARRIRVSFHSVDGEGGPRQTTGDEPPEEVRRHPAGLWFSSDSTSVLPHGGAEFFGQHDSAVQEKYLAVVGGFDRPRPPRQEDVEGLYVRLDAMLDAADGDCGGSDGSGGSGGSDGNDDNVGDASDDGKERDRRERGDDLGLRALHLFLSSNLFSEALEPFLVSNCGLFAAHRQLGDGEQSLDRMSCFCDFQRIVEAAVRAQLDDFALNETTLLRRLASRLRSADTARSAQSTPSSTDTITTTTTTTNAAALSLSSSPSRSMSTTVEGIVDMLCRFADYTTFSGMMREKQEAQEAQTAQQEVAQAGNRVGGGGVGEEGGAEEEGWSYRLGARYSMQEDRYHEFKRGRNPQQRRQDMGFYLCAFLNGDGRRGGTIYFG